MLFVFLRVLRVLLSFSPFPFPSKYHKFLEKNEKLNAQILDFMSTEIYKNMPL